MQAVKSNARFWAYVNCGPVKLTLRPGQSLEWSIGGRTEEGFSSERTRWEWDGNTLTRHWSDTGRDCDGRYERSGLDTCHELWLMCGREPYTEGSEPGTWRDVIWPAWMSAGDVRIFDEAAQAAGY